MKDEDEWVGAKALRTPTGLEYAELQIIQNCLERAGKAFEMYCDVLEQANQDDTKSTIKAALWHHGLILMMSCFSKTGDQHRLIPEDIFHGIGNWEIAYKWLHDFRDSFAAHIFGPARQSETTVGVHPRTGDVLGFGPIVITVSGPGLEDMTTVKQLFQVTWEHVCKKVTEAHKAVEKEIYAMSPDQLLALPPAQMRMPATNELRMTRQRFREQCVKPTP